MQGPTAMPWRTVKSVSHHVLKSVTISSCAFRDELAFMAGKKKKFYAALCQDDKDAVFSARSF